MKTFLLAVLIVLTAITGTLVSCTSRDVEIADNHETTSDGGSIPPDSKLEPQIVVGMGSPLDGNRSVTLCEDCSGTYTLDSFQMHINGSISMMAHLEYDGTGGPDATFDFRGSAFLTSIHAERLESAWESLVPLDIVICSTTDANVCGFGYQKDVDLPTDVLTAPPWEIAFGFTWLRVFVGADKRWYFQWTSGDYGLRAEPPKLRLDGVYSNIEGQLVVYNPISEDESIPLPLDNGNAFDYVQWARTEFGPH